MGIRIRYTGGERKRKRQLDVQHPFRDEQLSFMKGEVYNLTKPEADALLSEYPVDFERVYSSEDGYEAAAGPVRRQAQRPDLAKDVDERRAEPRQVADDGDPEYVTLIVKRRVPVANDPRKPDEKVVVDEGQSIRLRRASAEHYMSHLPDHFEKVGG